MIITIAAVARIAIRCGRIMGIGIVCRVAGCRCPSSGSGGGCAGTECSFLEAGELLGEVVFAVHLRFLGNTNGSPVVTIAEYLFMMWAGCLFV